MRNFKMTIEYDGTRYNGWQRQGNIKNTIQEKLETVLSRMAERPVTIHGSGRTDAGVHARGQVANFHLQTRRTPADILEYLNTYLPEEHRRHRCRRSTGAVPQPSECGRKNICLPHLEQSAPKRVHTALDAFLSAGAEPLRHAARCRISARHTRFYGLLCKQTHEKVHHSDGYPSRHRAGRF